METRKLKLWKKFINMSIQCKIARTLNISSFSFHIIIKCEDISVRTGQGRKSILGLGWHCIKNRHESVVEITALAQEHFQKS